MFFFCNCCFFVETPTKTFYMRLFRDHMMICFCLGNWPGSDKSYNRRFPSREGKL